MVSEYFPAQKTQVIDNDTDNFAPEGNIVGEVPRGTGIIIQANSNIEVFDNDSVNAIQNDNNLSINNYDFSANILKFQPGGQFQQGSYKPMVLLIKTI